MDNYSELLDYKGFVDLKSNKERIKFILTHDVKPLPEFHKEVIDREKAYRSKQRKDFQKSKSFRNRAQICWDQKDYGQALRCLIKVSIYLFFKNCFIRFKS